MSTTPIPIELIDYVRDLFAPEDAAFKALTEAAHAFGMPPDWEISPDVGRLFQLFCRAVGAKRVLEFGTFAGHSALWFARALPADGQVVSIEMNPDYAAFARAQLDKTDSGARIDIRLGAARDVLPALEREVQETGAHFDVIFLDADKPHYPVFLEWCPRVLRPGGMILADNVLRSGSWSHALLDPEATDPRIPGIREFNRRLATDPRFTSMIIPLRSGIAAGVFHP
jgi:caffeoyl-CoA O-methyltransferase